MLLDSNVVKIDPKITILLRKSKYVRHSVNLRSVVVGGKGHLVIADLLVMVVVAVVRYGGGVTIVPVVTWSVDN